MPTLIVWGLSYWVVTELSCHWVESQTGKCASCLQNSDKKEIKMLGNQITSSKSDRKRSAYWMSHLAKREGTFTTQCIQGTIQNSTASQLRTNCQSERKIKFRNFKFRTWCSHTRKPHNPLPTHKEGSIQSLIFLLEVSEKRDKTCLASCSSTSRCFTFSC